MLGMCLGEGGWDEIQPNPWDLWDLSHSRQNSGFSGRKFPAPAPPGNSRNSNSSRISRISLNSLGSRSHSQPIPNPTIPNFLLSMKSPNPFESAPSQHSRPAEMWEFRFSRGNPAKFGGNPWNPLFHRKGKNNPRIPIPGWSGSR